MIYGYARVSTLGQANDGNSLEDQIRQLRENGATEIYSEAWSGMKADRPEFQKVLSMLQEGDTLVVTKLDRFSRNAQQGLEIVEDVTKRGAKMHILNMGMVDISTPMGKLMMTMLLAFAEFERNMIVERTRAGKAIAKLDPNYREGRPKKEIPYDVIQTYKKMVADKKMTIVEVCKELGVSRQWWYRQGK